MEFSLKYFYKLLSTYYFHLVLEQRIYQKKEPVLIMLDFGVEKAVLLHFTCNTGSSKLLTLSAI